MKNLKQLLRFFPKSKFKVLLCMKWTTLLLLAGFVQASARAFSQESRLSLHLQDVKLERVLNMIQHRTGYRFLYNTAEVPVDTRISISANDKPVETILDSLLSQLNLSYQVLNNRLVVIAPHVEQLQTVVVHGRVTDTAGRPLIGVTIQVKGSTAGTVTNENGEFQIEVPDDAVLIVSYVGYQSVEIPVGGRSSLSVVLRPSVSQLNEVVVVGYGTQKKLDVTGAVAQINGSDIAKQSSVNAISALQGKVAGVQITNSGAPGASPEIRIRGLGTVYGDPNPLYVVDGVWYSDISFLNPADIESISILKDASAESIYGIRAANGVVLITTKKGIPGKVSVSYNGYAGWQSVTHPLKMADAHEYAILINELYQINGQNPIYDPNQFGKGTDWYHQVLRNALITNHELSVNGGSEKNTYRFSLGYLAQDGLVEKNDYKRYTALVKNDFHPLQPLRVGYTITGAYSFSHDFPPGIFHELYSAAPVVPVYYADGSYGDPTDYNVGDGSNFNPQATIDFFHQQTRNYRLSGNVYAELELFKHLRFRTSWGGEFQQQEVRNYVPVYKATLKQQNSTSRLSVTRDETRNWIVENTLTYQNQFGPHQLTILAGQSAQRYKFYELTASAQNVPDNSEGDLYLSLGDQSTRYASDRGDLSTVASYFGRVNYAFKNRYLLNASFRADGSSKFTGSNRWGYFPSIGAGWVISEEAFMKQQHVFSYLKLRGSWGKIGNASVPSNISVLTVTQIPQFTAVFGNPEAYYTGASITTIVPPTTYWERGVGTDIGLEATTLNDRLNIEIDWYNKKTEKAIFDIPILGSLGTTSGTIIGNQADFQNRGVEFTLSWSDKLGTKWHYSINANLSYNANKVLSVTTGANPIYQAVGTTGSNNFNTRTIVGQPIGEFFGRKVIGVFQSQQDINSYVNKNGTPIQPTAMPGDFKFADINGDGVIDDRDRVVLGNPNPKYLYGINTTWSYQQFDLTLDFQGVAGVDIYNANLGFRYGGENFTQDFFDHRWHGPGTSNTYPSANIGGGQNYISNSFYVQNGSYFRVRNIQLGYTLPDRLTQRWQINRLRIYVNAQNALNFFSYKGFSPEVGGPPTRAGVDVNVYPLYATYNAGINLTF
ncbi:MAG: TonB-dependent receptor [Thermoflavifilum sp.]|nr:TonB-dependent receptor [Thermoflavifilum sp.]